MNIKDIRKIVEKYAKEYGFTITAPVIAQIVYHGKFGESPLAVFNNLFDIRAGIAWDGDIVHNETMKKIPRKKKTNATNCFRCYNSIEECIENYFLYIASYHRTIKFARTNVLYCRLLENQLFSTDKDYAKSLMNIIEEYKL